MLLKSDMISRLVGSSELRRAYTKAKLDQLIASQIKASRLARGWTQQELGERSEMRQGRISAAERPGAVNFSLDTLIRLAAAFELGLSVEFLSYSDMLRRENDFSQDQFNPVSLREDAAFTNGTANANNSSDQIVTTYRQSAGLEMIGSHRVAKREGPAPPRNHGRSPRRLVDISPLGVSV